MWMMNVYEYQKLIYEYIFSEEFEKMFNNTIFKGDDKCKDAMRHGLIWASLLTSLVDKLEYKHVSEMEFQEE